MNDSHQVLERLRRAVLADRRADDVAVDLEGVWEAAHGELDPEATAALAERAITDPHAALAWRLAVELEAPRARVLAFRPRRWQRILLAAAAVLAIGVIVPLMIEHRGGHRLRGDDPVTSVIADGAALAREAFILRWTPGPPGSSYEVWVGTTDLATVFEVADLGATAVQVPADRLHGLTDGDRLLWTVTTIDRRGRRSTSATFVVSLASS
jgi:hypothetical protein